MLWSRTLGERVASRYHRAWLGAPDSAGALASAIEKQGTPWGGEPALPKPPRKPRAIKSGTDAKLRSPEQERRDLRIQWVIESGADLRARTQAEYLYTAGALAMFGGVSWGVLSLQHNAQWAGSTFWVSLWWRFSSTRKFPEITWNTRKFGGLALVSFDS